MTIVYLPIPSHAALTESLFPAPQVYRAVFADGRVAAVKRAEIAPSVLASRQAEFQRELETLSQLRHRHLVPFLGFCEVASRELMLVYDFMPNGTLQVGFGVLRFWSL